MPPVPATRNHRDRVQDAPLETEEADLLIEAISLLGQRQQELDAWAAERERLADERIIALEQRQAEFDRRLDALEVQVGLLRVGDADGAESSPETRLERLRQQVEELRGGAYVDEAPGTQLPAPESAPTRVKAEDSAPPVPSASPPQQRVDFWQRIERLPRNRLDATLLVVGAVVVLYAGLWQIAVFLGFS